MIKLLQSIALRASCIDIMDIMYTHLSGHDFTIMAEILNSPKGQVIMCGLEPKIDDGTQQSMLLK